MERPNAMSFLFRCILIITSNFRTTEKNSSNNRTAQFGSSDIWILYLQPPCAVKIRYTIVALGEMKPGGFIRDDLVKGYFNLKDGGDIY